MELSHLKRWLTSLVAIPVLVAFLVKAPPAAFAVFIGGVAMIALWEYNRIVYKGLSPGPGRLIPIWGFITGLLLLYAAYETGWRHVPAILLINALGAGFLSIPRFKIDTAVVDGVSRQMQGLVYIPLALSCLILLRMEPDGVRWVFLILLVVFPGDVGAFYAGRFFGRRKLSPAISPGKTMEGAIGGLLVSIVVGFAFMFGFLPHLSRPGCLLLFVLISRSGQAGDLFESELKRVRQIKDSGSILPGHGGLLDRIDALLFAAPAAYLYKTHILVLF
jgi:phosphatidate cytidylyltransferase